MPALFHAFGTEYGDAINAMLLQLINAVPSYGDDTSREKRMNGAIAMMADIASQSGIEGMLAVQMVTCHTLAMETAAQAMAEGQTFEGVTENISRANRMMKTFVSQTEALERLRGNMKTVTIKHVNVSEGGQAIIGDVHHGVSDDKK